MSRASTLDIQSDFARWLDTPDKPKDIAADFASWLDAPDPTPPPQQQDPATALRLSGGMAPFTISGPPSLESLMQTPEGMEASRTGNLPTWTGIRNAILRTSANIAMAPITAIDTAASLARDAGDQVASGAAFMPTFLPRSVREQMVSAIAPNFASPATQAMADTLAEIGDTIQSATIPADMPNKVEGMSFRQALDFLRELPKSEEAQGIKPHRIKWWTENIAEQLPYLAVTVGTAGAGAAVGLGAKAATWAATIPTFGVEAQSALEETSEALMASGMGRDQAIASAAPFAAGVGAVNAALEKVGLDAILTTTAGRRLSGWLAHWVGQNAMSRIGGRISNAAITEGITEASQEATQVLGRFAATGDPASFDGALERIGTAAAVGAATGGGVTAPMAVAGVGLGPQRTTSPAAASVAQPPTEPSQSAQASQEPPAAVVPQPQPVPSTPTSQEQGDAEEVQSVEAASEVQPEAQGSPGQVGLLKPPSEMTRRELVEALAARNLPTTGAKPALVDRLTTAIQQEGQAGSEASGQAVGQEGAVLPAGEDVAAPVQPDPSTLNYRQLGDALRERGLPTQGTLAVRRARLREAIQTGVAPSQVEAQAQPANEAQPELASPREPSDIPSTSAAPSPASSESGSVAREPWEMSRYDYQASEGVWDAVEQELSTPTQRRKVSYRYVSPGPGGPFRGTGYAAVSAKRGDIIAGMMGQAEITTLGKVETARAEIPGADRVVAEIGRRHKEAVEQALAAGHPVPAHVLADYPDLAAKVKPVQSTPPVDDRKRTDDGGAESSPLALDDQAKLDRLLAGGQETVSERFLDAVLSAHPDIEIKTANNTKALGVKSGDRYVAWIDDAAAPKVVFRDVDGIQQAFAEPTAAKPPDDKSSATPSSTTSPSQTQAKAPAPERDSPAKATRTPDPVESADRPPQTPEPYEAKGPVASPDSTAVEALLPRPPGNGPAQAELDRLHTEMKAADDAWSEADRDARKAKDERDRSGYGTKKRETLEKRHDKLEEAASSRWQEYDASRKAWYAARLAQQARSDNLIEALPARYELAGDSLTGERRSKASEAMQKYLREAITAEYMDSAIAAEKDYAGALSAESEAEARDAAVRELVSGFFSAPLMAEASRLADGLRGKLRAQRHSRYSSQVTQGLQEEGITGTRLYDKSDRESIDREAARVRSNRAKDVAAAEAKKKSEQQELAEGRTVFLDALSAAGRRGLTEKRAVQALRAKGVSIQTGRTVAGDLVEARIAEFVGEGDKRRIRLVTSTKPVKAESEKPKGGSAGRGAGDGMAATGSLYDPATITPNPARIPPSPIAGGTAKPLRQIIFDVGSLLRRHVRTAKSERGTLGTYYSSWARTVIRFAGDMDTTAHELAHAIDDIFGLVRQWNTPRGVSKSGAELPQKSPFDDELFKPEFQQTVRKHYKKAKKRREGVAEFIRAWVVNPDAAKAAAPKFHAHFVKQVDPAAMSALRSFSDDVRQWVGSSAIERTMSNVEMQTSTPSIVQRIKDWLKRSDDSFDTTWLDRLSASALDSLSPVWKGVQFARDLRGIHDLLPSSDPKMLIRTFAGFDKKFFEVMKGGPTTAKNKPIDGMGGIEWLIEPLDSSSHTALEAEMTWAVAMMVNERIVERSALIVQEAAELASIVAQIAEYRRIESEDGPGVMIDDDPIHKVIRELQSRASGLRKSLGFNGPIERLAEFVHQRTERIAGVGGGIFSDVAQAKQALDEFKSFDPDRIERIKEAARRYRMWANATLQYARDKGRISSSQYDSIVERNEQYVAMLRVFEESDPEMFKASGGRRLASVRNVVNRFKGSTRPIQNPYISLLQQTYSVMRESDRNEAMNAVRDLLMEPRSMHEGVVLNLDSIGSRAKEGDKNTIKVFVDGNPEYWQFHGDIYAALNDWYERPGDGLFWRAIQAVAQIPRQFITHSPDFLARNFIRDQFQRSILSDNATKPWSVGTYLARRGITGTASDLREFHRFGGGMFGYFDQSQRGYQKEIARHIRRLSTDSNTILALPGMIARGYHNLAKASEITGRLAEFEKAYRAGIARGLSEYDAGLQAAYQARDLLDYSVSGTVVRQINKVIIFTNAAVQGLARTIRAAKTNPARFAARWGMYVAFPSIVFYSLIRALDQEEEWEQLPAWQKDFFWNIKIGPDLWLRIPKPWELGVAASGVERLLNQRIGGNDDAFDGYGESLKQAMIPLDDGMMAGPFRAIIEDAANYNLFMDRPIVSPWEDGLDLELREGTERASRIGRIIGEAVGKDARDIDHYLRSLFGGTGRLAMDASDAEWENTLRSFVGITARTPTYSAVDVQAILEFSERRGLQQASQVSRLKEMLRAAIDAESKDDKDRLAMEAIGFASALRDQIESSGSADAAESILRRRSSGSTRYRSRD